MRRQETGFTLIELLVVIAIIAILAAIAVPTFQSYRERAFDARATSALKNHATAEETYYAEYESYKTCTHITCPGTLPGINLNDSEVTLAMISTVSGFTGTATHAKGSGLTFTWNSATGTITH